MITFHKLSFSNFLSVGNQPVEIDLNSTKTTLVHGLNGSGKSTILDALCYSLFNKPFRKVNLPQLVNTQNKKGLVAEVEFSIGSVNYRVRRGQKPKLFQIFRNGEELDAKAADRDNQTYLEQNILKLTYKSFTQVVILGSSNFVPFMQLTTAGRRECVEDFLDIKVFSTMGVIAKERLRGLKQQQHDLEGDVSNLEYKLGLQRDRIREIETQSQGEVEELERKIANLTSVIDTEQGAVDLLQKGERKLIDKVDKLLTESPEAKSEEWKKIIYTLTHKIDDADKRLAFFRDNDECHNCGQAIEGELKQEQVERAQKEGDKFRNGMKDAQTHLDTHQRVLSEASVLQQKIQRAQQEIFKRQTLVETYQNTISETERRVAAVLNDSSLLDRENGKLDALEEEQQLLKQKQVALTETLWEHEWVVNLLRDSGIKTQVIKKYLPVMNKCIRNYLTHLEFPIHFVLDTEFNESVSSPLHQDFSYASFSEGQKGRIDLALLFTWREVGRLKNSVSTNLLLLDEVFSSSLDEEGKDRLLTLLRYKLPEDTRVVVVDHTLSGEFKDKFDRTIEVTRHGGFSKYN